MIKIGLFGIGLDTYWEQFDGLLDNLRNIRGKMNAWSKQGPAHHCAIGVGHIAGKIEKLGQIPGIDVAKI